MLKMSTIVCATDLTLDSNQALPLAATLAHGLGAKLIVANVIDERIYSASSPAVINIPRLKAERADHARPIVETALKEAPPVDWELDIEIGHPAREIHHLVETSRADLLVAATHNREGLQRLLLGSFTRRLLHSIAAPFLVAPANPSKPLTSKDNPMQSILLATDFSENGDKAVKLGLSLAEVFGATVHLATVMDIFKLQDIPSYDGSVSTAAAEQAQEERRKKLETLASSGGSLKTVTAVLTGVPHEALVTYAVENRIDLVCMGTRGSGLVEHLLVGSTTDRVIRMGQVPVLTVRA